jgi:hypothetical protein
MPRGRRKFASLAHLENQLTAVNAERERIIGHIKAVVAGLTAGVSHFVQAEKQDLTPIARRVKRQFSPAARAKLRASAKKRWAAAKKAGRTSLG